MHVRMHVVVCLDVSGYVCMHVCICVCIHDRIHVCMRGQIGRWAPCVVYCDVAETTMSSQTQHPKHFVVPLSERVISSRERHSRIRKQMVIELL